MYPRALLHAPPPLTQQPPSFPASKVNGSIRLSMTSSSVRIFVVGDTHDDWNLLEDSKAIHLLKPDLVLFTGRFFLARFLLFLGDFGNENVELVRSIAALKFPKAAILGNHDAWNTQKFSDKKKDAVQLQLESFGEEHVGYKRLDFNSLKLSVIGGRPFSCGGERLFRKQLLAKRYGVHNMNESAKKISEAALGTPKNHCIILLAHNGPTGLGSNLDDICGRDWVRTGGDHGDPDLALAISQLKGDTKHSVPLVVFGHMHKELAFGNGPRKMIVVGDDNTIYLNGAIVPRVKIFPHKQQTDCSSSSSTTDTFTFTPNSEGTLRAFTLIESKEGNLVKIAETWVSVIGDYTNVEEEHILFSNNLSNVSNL